MAGFTIGKVAKAAGVGVETVRFYERRGLIERPSSVSTSFREYPAEAVEQIRFIKRAQELGFTLAEISELLQLACTTTSSRSDVKQLAQNKLSAIRKKIVDLQSIEATLSQLVKDCSGRGDLSGCPIIDAITNDSKPCDHEEK